MRLTEPRRELRSERERDLAFRERQARREATDHHDATSDHEVTIHRREPPPVAKFAEDKRPRRAAPRKSLILVPFLILISLGAAAIATVAIVKEPQSARLQSRIDTLNGELTRTQQQLAALEAQSASTASVTNVKRVARNLRGLRRSVGGVQNAIVPLRAELNGLKVCLPQLQQELRGVAAYRGKKGTTTVGVSPACSGLLGGP
jgi:uncharacterized protein HemX